MVLVPDDDAHGSCFLGPHHLGHEGALAPLNERQPSRYLLVVLDEPTTTGRLGGDQGNPTVAHSPARGEYCRVGLQ